MLKTQKHLIIYGPSRAGKTTLAKMLHEKHNFMIMSEDHIIDAFAKTLPDVGINQTGGEKALGPFLIKFIERLTKDDSLNWVIEGGQCSVEMFFHKLNPEKFDVIGMGYTQISAQEHIDGIRKNDTEKEWTSGKTDEELLPFIKSKIDSSKRIQKSCTDLKLNFIDTSFDRQKVLEDFINGWIRKS